MKKSSSSFFTVDYLFLGSDQEYLPAGSPCRRDGTGISGATITVKGGKRLPLMTRETSVISVPSGKKVILQVAIGWIYFHWRFRLGRSENKISIFLTPDEKNMNEVVVVGYSDKKRGELTSAVSVSQCKEIRRCNQQ